MFGYVSIAKAKYKPKRKATHTYLKTHALSKQMAKAVQLDLVNGIKTFQNKIPKEKIFNAWENRDFSGILREIPWDELHDDVSSSSHLQSSIYRAGLISLEALPAPAREGLRWDTKNLKISRYLHDTVGDRVQRIKDDAIENIRSAVTSHFDLAKSPREVSNMIRGSIGLTDRLNTAVVNYTSGLKKQGMPDHRVDSLTTNYYDKLLDYRAMTIARTETRDASNTGQLYVWQEAANLGLIKRTAKKVWVVDGDPCEICIDQDGVAVPLDGFWSLSNGDVVDIPSDAHPNCYCGMDLDFEEEESDEESE